MKNLAFIFIFWLVLSNSQTFSQMWLQDMKSPLYVLNLKDEERNSVKRAIFIYRKDDNKILEELESVLSDAWVATEIIFLSKEEFIDFKPEDGDVVFSAGCSTGTEITTYVNSQNSTTACNFNLYLNAILYSVFDSEVKTTKIGSSNLHFEQPLASFGCSGKKTLDQIILDFYDGGTIYNWDLTHISTFVGMVSDQVDNTLSEVKSPLSILKTSTLYISEGVNIKANKFLNKDVVDDKSKMINRAYKYQHKIVTKEELDQLAIEGKEGFVLYPVRIDTFMKYIIIDLSTGQKIYSKSGYKYNVRGKDFKRLVKYINNPNKK